MALLPISDVAKIELTATGPFSAKPGDSATDGILVELGELDTHYGFYSFAFEDSFMAEEKLKRLRSKWEKKIGKRVYWLALSEKGAIFQEQDGRKFAYVKLTSILAWSEPDEHAEAVLDKHAGSFAA